MTKEYYGFVYLTTNMVNGKRYIGQTTRKESFTYFGSGKAIRKAIVKYGKENFTREILAYSFTKADLDFVETHLIEQFGAQDKRNFYNIAEGGKTTRGFTGKKHSEATKSAISNHLLNEHPGRGKKLTKEQCEARSVARTGIPIHTAEFKNKIRELGLSNKGKKFTDDQRAASLTKRLQNGSAKTWKIQTPDGIITTNTFDEWCRDHSVNRCTMRKTLDTGKPHFLTGYLLLSVD